MEHAVWTENLLNAVLQLGEEGRLAADVLRARGTKIGFKRVRPNIGAYWTAFGNIRLNTHYYSYETPLDDPKQFTQDGLKRIAFLIDQSK